MNKWLTKFWSQGFFRIVLVGARKSIGSPLLANILGNSQGGHRAKGPVQPAQQPQDLFHRSDSLRSNKFTVQKGVLEGVQVKSYIAPALSDSTGYKDERYFRKVRSKAKDAHLVIFCVDMSDTRLRGSVLRTLQRLNPDWRRTVIILTYPDASLVPRPTSAVPPFLFR